MVVQRHEDFPAVIGVDDPDLVGGSQPPLGGEAASRIHQARKPFGNLHGKPRMNQPRFPGRKDDLPVRHRVQIGPRRISGTVFGKNRAFVQLFHRYRRHNFFLP